MNLGARISVLVAIWTAAGFTAYFTCVQPFRCSVTEGRVLRRTTRALSRDAYYAAQIARRNVTDIKSCLGPFATVNQLMIAAVNYRILEQPSEAISLYERAMRFDRRPELYLNLGIAQIEAGQRERGFENIVTACKFNPLMLEDLVTLHDETAARVEQYKAEMEKRAATD